MEGSSQSAAGSGSSSLASMRDADGFLPLVQCPHCGTQLIGRVSQQPRSFGKRFYKCPKLEHTPLACKFYKMEKHYLEFLATYGVKQGGTANVRGPDLNVRELVEETNERIKEANGLLNAAIDVVQQCNVQMQSAACALKKAEGALKSSDERQMPIGAKIERIGERLVIVGLANILLVVLVLIVLLVK